MSSTLLASRDPAEYPEVMPQYPFRALTAQAAGRGRTTALVAGSLGLLLVLAAAALLVREGLPRWRAVDLSGSWLLELPAGFQYGVVLEADGSDRYMLKEAPVNFRGIYELREDRLVVVEPENPRIKVFEWSLLDDGTLKLVREPPVSVTGAQYTGATLTRRAAGR